ncbi:hypothetical protein Goe20_02400 [Bacillus phage vB_BsuM-Goe20]|nr:hypothetical protein Goe20_02400 [Bacillus phage vB_BsuM-Goe20]
MTNTVVIPDEVKHELLDQVEKFVENFMDERFFEMDEGVWADIGYLKYGIRKDNLTIIQAVASLTHNGAVCSFVTDLLNTIAGKGISE